MTRIVSLPSPRIYYFQLTLSSNFRLPFACQCFSFTRGLHASSVLGIQIHTLGHRFRICFRILPKQVSLSFRSYRKAISLLLCGIVLSQKNVLPPPSLQWKFRYSLSHNAISNFLTEAANRAFLLQPRPPRLSD